MMLTNMLTRDPCSNSPSADLGRRISYKCRTECSNSSKHSRSGISASRPRLGAVLDRPAVELMGPPVRATCCAFGPKPMPLSGFVEHRLAPPTRPCPAEPRSTGSWRPDCSVGVTSAAMASRFHPGSMADACVEFHGRHMGATLSNEEGRGGRRFERASSRVIAGTFPAGCDRDGRVTVRAESEHRARWNGSRPSACANCRGCGAHHTPEP
jgi:hypothetical protein